MSHEGPEKHRKEEEKEGHEVVVGPQHPALVEPVHLRVFLKGEKIERAELNLGYLHRGIELSFQGRDYYKNIYLAERICGICSGVHTTAYCMGVEKLLGVEPPENAGIVRTVMCELERIHSHMLWLGVLGYEIGLDTMFQVIWRDRELVLDVIEKISGGRIHYAINTLGGTRRGLSRDIIKELVDVTRKIEERASFYEKLVEKDRLVRERMENVGVLERKDAIKNSVVGPVARASGVAFDLRTTGYAAYHKTHFKPIVLYEGDILARAIVRIREIAQSARIARTVARQYEEGKEHRQKLPPIVRPEPGASTTRVEAPRGELFYYIRSNGTNIPERVKSRTPTLANLGVLESLLDGEHLADLPAIVSSLDPCVCCTERVQVVKDGKPRTVSKSELSMLSRNRTRERK